METKNPSVELFARVFNSIETVIPFERSWKNGTGYFNGAVNVKLAVGEQAKAVCDDSARRIIMTGTPLGTVVVFERYSPEADKRSDIFVGNYTSEFKQARLFDVGSALNTATLDRLLGDSRYPNVMPNCGQTLAKAHAAMSSYTTHSFIE